jgi:hypothetical protein
MQRLRMCGAIPPFSGCFELIHKRPPKVQKVRDRGFEFRKTTSKV